MLEDTTCDHRGLGFLGAASAQMRDGGFILRAPEYDLVFVWVNSSHGFSVAR